MGCGASKDPKVAVADSHRPLPNQNKNYQNKNGFKQVELKNNSQNFQNVNTNNNNSKVNNKAPLAFEIMFDENNSGAAKRPPPGRLRLEPIKHNPTTTKAEIDDKIRSAELKRERILADRAKSTSGKKNSQGIKRNTSDKGMDSDSYNRNDSQPRFNQRPDSSENDNKQRLLNRRRIIQNQDYDDDDIEHDRNYNKESYDFDRRY